MAALVDKDIALQENKRREGCFFVLDRPIPKDMRIIFQPSIFRWELLLLGKGNSLLVKEYEPFLDLSKQIRIQIF